MGKGGWIVAHAFGAWLACAGMPAIAGDVCATGADPAAGMGARVGALACTENVLWRAPFIDNSGRLASMTVAEAERSLLADGATPAWRRVVDYWRGSGLLGGMASRAGARECALPDGPFAEAACRGFVVDTPWSAAFVSWVMVRAGVTGFRVSATHFDYVRDAAQRADSPYLLADPDATVPAAGDLLCFSRQPGVHDYAGLRALIARSPQAGLAMHCDIVGAIDAQRGRAYLVGGNVLQGATLRVLNVNRKGLFWDLPRRGPGCGPGNEAGCSFNRQDWIALLKLKPMAVPATAPPLPVPATQPECCEVCQLPMPPGMQRCPAPADTDPAPQAP
jgi:hypothetical protein